MGLRLLLAEDTRDLNRALTMVLEHEGYEVLQVFDGEEALGRIRTEALDGVILDIMMPKKSGLEVLREMRASGVYTPVLLLTAKAEVDDRVVGLDAGADDYLTKPFAMKELLARVRSMTRRREEYSIERLTFGDVSLNADTFELTAGNSIRLSVKEFELMQTLVLNVERPLAWDYLLEHVWRAEPGVDKDTVELYMSYVRAKLKWVGSRVVVESTDDGFRLVDAEQASEGHGDADAAGREAKSAAAYERIGSASKLRMDALGREAKGTTSHERVGGGASKSRVDAPGREPGREAKDVLLGIGRIATMVNDALKDGRNA